MESNKSDNTFSYNYSAKDKEEILKLRQKYLPKAESQIDILRRMDAAVYNKATLISIVVGISGTLTLGLGMCCCMVWGDTMFFPGIVIGLLGIAVLSAAYPLYNRVLKKERKKIAPEILRITEELMR